MQHWVCFLMLMTFPACAQVVRPHLTWTLDAAGAVRPVYGIAGSATLGDPAMVGVLSMACSELGCMMKTDVALRSTSTAPPVEPSRVWVKRGQSDSGAAARHATLAPEGPALLAPAGAEAYIYFTSTQQFARWRDGDIEYFNVAVNGDVLSLRASGDGFDYAVARDDSTWIEHYSVLDDSAVALGQIGPTGAVLLLEGGGLLAASADGVRLLRPYAGDQPLDDVIFALPNAGRFIAAPAGLVQVNTATGVWLLSTASGSPESFLLPPSDAAEAAQ